MPRLTVGLACLAACAAVAVAQPQPLPTPRLNNAFPAGARQGATVEVAVNGADLDTPTGLHFSHPGIKGEYLPPPAPDPKKMPSADVREKAASRGPHNFKVTVAADVPVGVHDLRVVSRFGVSNPRAFVVGDLPDVNEKEPNNDVPEAQRVELGTTVNGSIGPTNTDVDYFTFAAKKGQRVVLSCLASTLDGKARPLVEVYDATGRKVAVGRNDRETDAVVDVTAPADGEYVVRLCEFAYAGGGADYPYRLTIGTGPWLDAVFPPVVAFGKPANVTLYGRNLPGGKPSDFTGTDGRPLEQLAVTINPPKDVTPRTLAGLTRVTPPEGVQDGFEYRLTGPNGTSNPVRLFFAREKIHLRKSPGGLTAATAEPLPVPCEAVGMITHRGDVDWYGFAAKKGDVLMVDLLAERIGTRADYFFSVHHVGNNNNDLLGEIDDDPDGLHTTLFSTRSADPAPLRWTVPFDGEFRLRVAAREAAMIRGPRTAYRLRVGPPKPDFRAVVLPYSRYFHTGSGARRGGTEGIDVFVHRVDGFNGPVTAEVEGLPAGVTAKPVVVGPVAKWGLIPLAVAADAKPFTGEVRVKVSAVVDGKAVAENARPASVLWGTRDNPNQPLFTRLTRGLVLAVRPEPAYFAVAVDLPKATLKVKDKDEPAAFPLILREGEKATIPLKATWPGADKPNVALASEPMSPNGQNNLVGVSFGGALTKDKPDGTMTVEVRPNAPPGTYTVAVRGDAQVSFAKDEKGAKTATAATAFAEPFAVRVLPNAVVKLTLGTIPPGALKVGGSVEVAVTVERTNDFAGPLTVTFGSPSEAKGVTAAEVVVPPGQSTAKLVLKAAADVKPTNVANGWVKVVAVVDKHHTLTHEAKLTFAVAK